MPVNLTAPPQAGVFRLGYFLGTEGSSAYVPADWYRSGGQVGPFYEVQSAYTPPPGFNLRANEVHIFKTNCMVVACGGGSALVITALVPEGKRQMTAGDFLRGSPLRPGHRLGDGA